MKLNNLLLNNLTERHYLVLDLLAEGHWLEVGRIIKSFSEIASISSIKRDLSALNKLGLIEHQGAGRATKYRLKNGNSFFVPINVEKYFSKTQDERGKNLKFNFEVFKYFQLHNIFIPHEKKKLSQFVNVYQKNLKMLSATLIKREFERVTIDLSWKSSVIEGNTYSLLETETLLKDGIQAPGKTKEEAIMLLNHKRAIEFIRNNHSEFKNISISKIEYLHSLLGEDLGISKNIRMRIVGITGTNYKPLDNEFQIREALENLCQLINATEYPFAKAIIAILFVSYIQPFEDGNKRTARLLGNAILLSENYFPLSFRSVDITQYKLALLLFYEKNNIYLFKKLFLEQADFAVHEYFC